MSLYEYKAELVKVVDGDTIDVRVDLGFHTFQEMRLRLLGIDTPEKFGVSRESEEYAKGVEAANRVKELLTDRTFIIKTDKDRTGKYGRYLATVFVDDINLNETLVNEGLAERY